MFKLGQMIKYEDLQDDSRYGTGRTVFTFPETLSAVCFGASLVVFYSTCKRIAHSELSTPRKVLAFVALGVLFALGVVSHALEVDEVKMDVIPKTLDWEDVRVVSFNAYGLHHSFMDKLQGFIVIFTGWVAAAVLATRTYILAGRSRRLGVLLNLILYVMLLAQLLLFCMGSRFRHAFPSHPIINLILQIPVTLAVLFHAFTCAPRQKKRFLCALEDVLVDSGALLTVALILQMIFPFVGLGFVPMNFLLPHIQNMTACTVFVRLIDGVGVGGWLWLRGEEIFTQPGSTPVSPV